VAFPDTLSRGIGHGNCEIPASDGKLQVSCGTELLFRLGTNRLTTIAFKSLSAKCLEELKTKRKHRANSTHPYYFILPPAFELGLTN